MMEGVVGGMEQERRWQEAEVAWAVAQAIRMAATVVAATAIDGDSGGCGRRRWQLRMVATAAAVDGGARGQRRKSRLWCSLCVHDSQEQRSLAKCVRCTRAATQLLPAGATAGRGPPGDSC